MTYQTNTLLELDVQYPADSVEWCHLNSFTDVLLCGNYELHLNNDGNSVNTKSRRLGRILLMQISDDLSSIIVKHEHNTEGILDIKWSHKELYDKRLFATVDSEGSLSLWECFKNCNIVDFTLSKTYSNFFDDKCLALSLDWNNVVNNCNPKIVVSYSNGFLAVFDCNENDINLCNKWKAHDFEAWICAFNYLDHNMIFSGGDDCLFNTWDERMGFNKPAISKSHSMGICSIQHNFHEENLLATGGYDEHILIWDLRIMKTPITDFNAGGGVWRIKWEPQHGNYLAAACMHNGCQIIDLKTNSSDASSAVSYNKHQSLAYGIDWHFPDITEKSKCKTLASCSFYDHSLHLWNFEIK